MHRHLLATVLVIPSLLLCACDKADTSSAEAPSAPTAPAGTFPASLFAGAPIDGTVGVGEAKSAAKQGDRVRLVGRIGGSEQPFMADRAMFVLVDPSVKLCGEDESGDDRCPTPYDFCCEPRENLRKMSITIVANGADGSPIAHTLLGQGGLKPGIRVAIEGTVSASGPDGAAVVAADRIVVQ